MFAPGSTYQVSFCDELSDNDLRLLEVSPDMLKEFEQGKQISLKGSSTDEMVLCTETKTFLVRQVETSNALLLVDPTVTGPEITIQSPIPTSSPSGKDKKGPSTSPGPAKAHAGTSPSPSKAPMGPQGSISVSARCACHYELVLAAPRLHRLRGLLSEKYYTPSERSGDEPDNAQLPLEDSGDGEEEAKREKRAKRRRGFGYTFTELEKMVLASPAEIQKALDQIHALEIDGCLRLVDPDELSSTFEAVLATVDANGWTIDHVPAAECRSDLATYDPIIVDHALKVHGSPKTKAPNGDVEVWTLDPVRVCRYRAVQILSVGKLRLDTFMENWRGACPDSCTPELSMLNGMVLVDSVGPEKYIRHFLVESLPIDPKERIRDLFIAKARWTLAELEPYIKDLVAPGESLEHYLLKFARAIPTPGQETVFTLRD